MAFRWNEEKNNVLKIERGISFERIVVAIEEGHLIDIIASPNSEKHSNQSVMVIEIDRYTFCVPFVIENSGDYFLKTIFPSRKYRKRYGIGDKND